MNFLIKLILYAVAALLTSYLLPGVHISGFLQAFLLSVVLALLNATIKPMLILFTIPLTILSLGLFLIVINAGLLLLADYFIPGSQIDGFWWAVLFGLIVSIINGLLTNLAGTKKLN